MTGPAVDTGVMRMMIGGAQREELAAMVVSLADALDEARANAREIGEWYNGAQIAAEEWQQYYEAAEAEVARLRAAVPADFDAWLESERPRFHAGQFSPDDMAAAAWYAGAAAERIRALSAALDPAP